MSETPRTDRAVARWPLESFGEMTGLARQLERENAALREQLAERDAEIARLKERSEQQRAERAEAELAKLRQLTAQQAEDDGLWFSAATAPEAYLQQELRKLHAAVEGAK